MGYLGNGGHLENLKSWLHPFESPYTPSEISCGLVEAFSYNRADKFLGKEE